VYPCRPRLTHAVFVGALAAFAVAGCGGTASVEVESATARTVSGPGFRFAVSQGRKIERTPRSVTVLPPQKGSEELESVTIFPLVKPYRPALWPQAAEELDGVAERLADSLGGELLGKPETVRRSGLRGRLYEIAYEREGVELRQRLTLLLTRRTEYQLLCRWDASGDMPEACTTLELTFSVSA
jgi:hypothetical protein